MAKPWMFKPVEPRLCSQISINSETGCWIFNGSTTKGYGVISVEGRPQYAHRIAYKLWVGPIPMGMVVDHLCRTPRCVNPEHLEPVPNRENVLRGKGETAVAYRAGTCTNGHPRTPENAYRRKDRPESWNCNVCRRERRAAQSASRERGELEQVNEVAG